MLTFKEKLKLLRTALCIIGCHLVMGIFQEKILKHPYGEGDNKENFNLAIAYVGVQCISYAIISKSIYSKLVFDFFAKHIFFF